MRKIIDDHHTDELRNPEHYGGKKSGSMFGGFELPDEILAKIDFQKDSAISGFLQLIDLEIESIELGREQKQDDKIQWMQDEGRLIFVIEM